MYSLYTFNLVHHYKNTFLQPSSLLFHFHPILLSICRRKISLEARGEGKSRERTWTLVDDKKASQYPRIYLRKLVRNHEKPSISKVLLLKFIIRLICCGIETSLDILLLIVYGSGPIALRLLGEQCPLPHFRAISLFYDHSVK